MFNKKKPRFRVETGKLPKLSVLVIIHAGVVINFNIETSSDIVSGLMFVSLFAFSTAIFTVTMNKLSFDETGITYHNRYKFWKRKIVIPYSQVGMFDFYEHSYSRRGINLVLKDNSQMSLPVPFASADKEKLTEFVRSKIAS